MDLPILILVRDLLLMSQIRLAAGRAGKATLVFRDPAVLKTAEGRRLIVDLNLPGAIEAAEEYRQRTGQAVVGFVSHVDTETIARARAAGLDRVVARSAFFGDVESFLE